MNEKMVKLLMGMIMSTSLYAGDYTSDTKSFLGLELGYGTVDADTANAFKHMGQAVEYGIRIGSQNDEWRATFSFDYFNSVSDDQTLQKGLGMLDYFIYTSRGDMNIKPFVGANIGYGRYESASVDATGLGYGIQGGVILGFENNIDLDLSYRYTLFQPDAINSSGTIVFGLNYLY